MKTMFASVSKEKGSIPVTCILGNKRLKTGKKLLLVRSKTARGIRKLKRAVAIAKCFVLNANTIRINTTRKRSTMHTK